MIHLITGGERSGKSGYAQKLAEEMSDDPIYLATAKVWDDGFKSRVKRHQADRDSRWQTIEEQTKLSSVLPDNRVVLIDCVTLWLTNYFSQYKGDKERCLEEAKAEFEKLQNYDGTLIIITNEIGMGVHAHNQSTRDFVELQGWVNQHIAKHASKVTLMVSGIPMKMK